MSVTVQSTAVFEVPPTSAVKLVVKPAFAVAVAGEMERVTGCELMVIAADAESVGMLREVAVTVASPPGGTEAGAT
jgi:hypothetical protein